MAALCVRAAWLAVPAGVGFGDGEAEGFEFGDPCEHSAGAAQAVHAGDDRVRAYRRKELIAHADGDVEAFILMTGLADEIDADEIDAAIAEAVKGLPACGASPAMPHDSDGGQSRSPKILHLGREQPRASSPIGGLDSATDHPS